MRPTKLKIRLTDSLCVAKFSYIKPEVEMEFDINASTTMKEEQLAYETVADALEQAVDMQLTRICRRASAQDKVMIKNSVEVDIRLKRAVRDWDARKAEHQILTSQSHKRELQLTNLDWTDSSWGLS